jgi:integrase
MKGIKGTIICNKCRKKMTSQTCACGSEHCYIATYADRKHVAIRKDLSGNILEYDTAVGFLMQINAGGNLNPFQHDAEKLMEQWLNYKREQERAGLLAPSYVSTLEFTVQNHMQMFFAGTAIAAINADKLTEFLWSLKLKSQSKHKIMTVMRQFMKWALEHDYISKIPKFPKVQIVDAKAQEALTVDEQDEAMSCIPEDWRPIYKFGAETGLRSGELCALRISDINLRKRTMTVQHNLSNDIDRNVTKGRHSDTIPLSGDAIGIAEKVMGDRKDDEYMFINPWTKRRFTTHGLLMMWKRMRPRRYAGITVHELIRHSFCTQLVDSGTPVFIAQDLMRHKTLAMTEKYFKRNPEKGRQYVDTRKHLHLVDTKGSEKETI